MAPLELLIYQAERTIVKGEPGLYEITSEHVFHRFEPIPNEDFRWADGFFRAKIRGGTDPSYRIRIPAGELFDKEVGPGIVRTFLRTPEKKALDGVEIIFAVQFGEYGFEQLPLAGGKVIEVETPRPAKLPKAAIALKAAAPVPIEPEPAPAPKPRPARPRDDRPVVYSGRTAQASLFGEEVGVA